MINKRFPRSSRIKMPSPIRYWYPGARVYGKEEVREVVKVLRSKSTFRYYGIRKPEETLSFEKALARRLGARFALGVSSGTAALLTALMAAGVGHGDEVIVPSNTFIATAGATVMVGAIPVLAEIDASLCLAPDDIERHITEKTRAIIPVHFQGCPCVMDRIMRVARKHKLIVIEDCAQSLGASYKGKSIGTIGHIGCFSFQYNKVITGGEGGAVVTNDAGLFERAVRAHDHGQIRGGHGIEEHGNFFFGINMRMSELTAAVALAQLRKLDARIIRPCRAAARAILAGIRNVNGIELCAGPRQHV